MPVINDWKIFYDNDPDLPKQIVHVDGVLSYGSGSGTQPSIGEYILGATSGAVAKVIERTGDETSGTLTLTNVVGRFVSGETLSILSELDFDAVTPSNGGFAVGDTIAGNSSGSTIAVKAIEYNYASDGVGTMYGAPMSAAFTDSEQLDISGGQADVADAVGTGTDNDAKFSATTSSALVVPGTANTNNSVIVHYDGGTIAVPEGARISDASSGAVGYAQQVYGATDTGSVRVVDSNTTGGAWTNNNTLRIEDCLYYDNLQAGKVFSVGDVVVGSVSGATGRVLAVIDDGDNTGKLILANKSGTWNDTDNLNVGGVKIAEVENATNKYLDAATLNLPGGVYNEQLASQGGLYPAGSLNIVRSSNALYTFLMDTFDELGQLDDKPPVEAKGKDLVYVLVNGYIIPPLSFRFLESGGWQDSGKNNYWTNFQTIGTIADIGNHGFFYDASNPTPRPNLYVESDGAVLSPWWLPGHMNALIQNKTSLDTRYINPAVPSIGQLIDGGEITIHAREYLRNYDWNASSQVGGVAPVSLGTANDLYSVTGTHRISYTGTGGFTVGEEIVGGTTGARGIVTAEDVTGDTLDYVLKTPSTQFGSAETITGQVSGATCTFSSVASLVAGYNADIRLMTVTDKVSGGTTTGVFIVGEPVTQDVTGATGWLMEDDGSLYIMKNNATAFSGNNDINGDTSTAAYSGTLSYEANQTTVPKNLGDGSGPENYTGVISADITGADPQLVASVYEWTKYVTSREATAGIGKIGNAIFDVEGRLFKSLYPTWPVVKICPTGYKAGAAVYFAQGWFLQKETLDSADIQNFQLTNNAGLVRTPPNLQALLVQGLPITGVRVEVSRTATLGGVIQRTEFQVGAVGGGYNQAGDTKILFAAQDRTVGPIPADVPDSGVVRILDPNDSGAYLRFEYDTIDRSNNWVELTAGTIGDVTGAVDLTAADNLHVEFISEQVSGTTVNNTIQYLSDIYLYWVARLKGYDPADGTATFGATGATVNVQMSADDIVDLP